MAIYRHPVLVLFQEKHWNLFQALFYEFFLSVPLLQNIVEGLFLNENFTFNWTYVSQLHEIFNGENIVIAKSIFRSN